MSYIIYPETKTSSYIFSISWIDDVAWKEMSPDNKRDVQTWFGADPTLALQETHVKNH